MHTDDEYNTEVEENDYSDFYNSLNVDNNDNNDNKKEHNGKKGLKTLLIIIGLLLILGALVFFLLFILKKEKPVEFSLTMPNVNSDTWSKENVTINIDVPDDANLKSIKYTINCEKDCQYVNVVDRKIVISNNGLSKVSVITVNKDNVENKKDVTIKIDNVSPNLTLSPSNTNISSKEPVTVCAICSDNESGCKEEKVCKTYSKTSTNQTLTVEDNAGNKTMSTKFSVTINAGTPASKPATAPTCSLSVNSNGLVTAKYSSADTYHGFASNYSGKSEITKQLSLTNGQTSKVTYYVKNKDGKTSSCSINVKASCICKYRGDNGVCYKTLAKTIDNTNGKADCSSATKKASGYCYIYKDEGLTCTYASVK